MDSSGAFVGSGPLFEARLDYPRNMKITSIVLLLFFAGVEIAFIFTPDETNRISLFGICVFLFFTIMCFALVLETFLTYFIIDGQGIHAHMFYHHPFDMGWDEIEHIYPVQNGSFKVIGTNAKFGLSIRSMSNIPQFAYFVRTHVPESKYLGVSSTIQEMCIRAVGHPVPAYGAEVSPQAVLQATNQVQKQRKTSSNLLGLTVFAFAIVLMFSTDLEPPWNMVVLGVVVAAMFAVLFYFQGSTRKVP